MAVCYFVYFYHRRKADEPPAWLGLALLLVAVFIGYGLGAAQLLPSYELSQMSVRQIDPPERMFAFSYPPRHLVSMFYGNAFGNPVTGLQDLFARGAERLRRELCPMFVDAGEVEPFQQFSQTCRHTAGGERRLEIDQDRLARRCD